MQFAFIMSEGETGSTNSRQPLERQEGAKSGRVVRSIQTSDQQSLWQMRTDKPASSGVLSCLTREAFLFIRERYISAL
jgi:hypothetical protein